jgi:hypothetical protein
MPRVLPQSQKFGVGPDAYEFIQHTGPSLLWVPKGSVAGVDLSDNGLTPTAQNTGDLTLTTGPYPKRVIGGAPVCEFGGTNGYVTLPDNAAMDLPGAFAAMMHLRFDALAAGSVMSLLSKSDFGQDKRTWHLFYRVDQQDFAFGSSKNGLAGPSNVCFYTHDYTANTDDWITVFAVFDSSQGAGARQRGYVDGSLLSSTAVDDNSITPYNNDVPVAIGARRSSGTYGGYLSASVSIAGVFWLVLFVG